MRKIPKRVSHVFYDYSFRRHVSHCKIGMHVLHYLLPTEWVIVKKRQRCVTIALHVHSLRVWINHIVDYTICTFRIYVSLLISIGFSSPLRKMRKHVGQKVCSSCGRSDGCSTAAMVHYSLFMVLCLNFMLFRIFLYYFELGYVYIPKLARRLSPRHLAKNQLRPQNKVSN